VGDLTADAVAIEARLVARKRKLGL